MQQKVVAWWYSWKRSSEKFYEIHRKIPELFSCKFCKVLKDNYFVEYR